MTCVDDGGVPKCYAVALAGGELEGLQYAYSSCSSSSDSWVIINTYVLRIIYYFVVHWCEARCSVYSPLGFACC